MTKKTPKIKQRPRPPGKPVILRPVPARRFYFAYGSNLNVKAMMSRCDSARKVGAFKLPGWRLVFRHVADIEPGGEFDYVPGGIWEITPDDEVRLDRYEGVRYGKYGQDGGGSYRKLSFPIVTKRDNAVHDVLVYVMNKRERGIMPPSASYYNSIMRGYKEFGLDLDMLEAALARSWDEKQPTEELQGRWTRMGRFPLKPRPLGSRTTKVPELPFLDVDAGEDAPAQTIQSEPRPNEERSDGTAAQTELPLAAESDKPVDPQPEEEEEGKPYGHGDK